MPDGPYLVLPILGPSNVRDAVGKLPSLLLTDPLLLISDEPYLGVGRYGVLRAGFRTLHAIDLRSQMLSADSLISMQIDPYLFVREAHRQRRKRAIQRPLSTHVLANPLVEEQLFRA